MSEKLTLAEAYYTVARDLERQANRLRTMGEHLFGIADHLCEENMREVEALVAQQEQKEKKA